MKRGFLELYKKLKSKPELKIPGIKQKIKDFTPEFLALLIYPILEDNSRHVRIRNMKFDPERIREINVLTKKYQELKIGRVFIFGPDLKTAYELINSMNCIYVDELNTLLITQNEIQLSININWYDVEKKIHHLYIEAIYFDFNRAEGCGIYEDYADTYYSGSIEEYYSRPFIKFGELPVMFLLLLNKYGPTHKELAFVNGMKYTEPDKQENLINNHDTKLVKSYIERVCLVHRRESRQIFSPINEMLDDMDINVIADYTYREARTIHLKMIDER